MNSYLARGGGNLNTNFPKIQIPGGCLGGVMLKLRFEWYISYMYSSTEKRDGESEFWGLEWFEVWKSYSYTVSFFYSNQRSLLFS